MTRRNPTNDRYTVEGNAAGKTRKSAASAKPKYKAGESINEASGDTKKKKGKRTERKQEEQEEFETLGPRAREKYLQREYVKWNDWRRRMVILAFIALFVAIIYRYSVVDTVPLIEYTLWVLPFAFIGIGIWMSFAKQRPIGRVLGIKYGKQEQAAAKASRKEKKKELEQKYNEREDEVAARVKQKEEKDQAREKRRLQNKHAESQHIEEQRASVQKAKQGKKK